MAEDLHENRSNAGVRILGGDFEVKKLKREIRIFGQNAHTELKIQFEQIVPENGRREGPPVADQPQKFVFPFSDDKNLTYFQAKYVRHDGTEIQTLQTRIEEKQRAKQEYQKAIATQKVGAMVTSAFRMDEYTIEMGNKPEGTKYIDVELKYFETLKTEYRYKERLFTLTVPRHKKTRYNPLFADDMDVDDAEISDSSLWIDEIQVIEPRPSHTNSTPAYQIVNIELDDKRWEIDAKEGREIAEGKKWCFYEIDESVPSGNRRDRNGMALPDKAPEVGQAKNDLEVRFFMKTNVPPAINIEYMDASESEAIVSIELSEENLREQIINMPAQDIHADSNMEYDSNNTPGSSVVSAQPMEYVFLIDCSGSMSGTFMENTRRTMSLIMKSIDVGSKVIFCRFGSRYIFKPAQNGQAAEDDEYGHFGSYHRRNQQRRVPEMRDANWITIDDEDDRQEEEIKNIISDMRANLGGTEIREPLLDILQLKQDSGVYRNIIVLTDGAVSNTEEVHRVVREEAIKREGYLRFFALGIGSGASRTLCDGIAKFGRGSSVYVLDEDRIQAKASLILQNASRPSIYIQNIALPFTLERLGYSLQGDLDMTVFGFKRIYLHLKSKNQLSIWRNLEEGVRDESFSLSINRERIPMMNLKHLMQPWYNNAVKLRAFWAKQEINYLDDADIPINILSVEAKYAYQVETSKRGGTLCDHTAFIGVMDRVGTCPQELPLRIQHEGANTSSGRSITLRSGYMAAGGSSSPFGRPPASAGIGSAGRAMFSGMSMIPSAMIMPMGCAMKGRSPMVGGIGGMMRSKAFSSDSSDSDSEESFPPPGNPPPTGIPFSNKKNDTEKLSTFDKLMSLVKRNGLWPASEGKAILGCLMKYNKNFDKIFEDFRNRIKAVDHILTVLVLAALEKYEEKNEIEWAKISIKAKTKLSANKIDPDAEIKNLSMIL